MKLTVLSDPGSWKNPAIEELLRGWRSAGHTVAHCHDLKDLPDGDLLFLLGFFQIVPPEKLKSHTHALVVHESDLPRGRGWSPLSWQVLEGAPAIPLTLFEAVEKIDAGPVYLRDRVALEGHELLPEIHRRVAAAIIGMCRTFVEQYPKILNRAQAQQGTPTLYPRRGPEHSRLDPARSIEDQFNLLRTVDNDDYPAFFTLHGFTYVLKIEKKGPDGSTPK